MCVCVLYASVSVYMEARADIRCPLLLSFNFLRQVSPKAQSSADWLPAHSGDFPGLQMCRHAAAPRSYIGAGI